MQTHDHLQLFTIISELRFQISPMPFTVQADGAENMKPFKTTQSNL